MPGHVAASKAVAKRLNPDPGHAYRLWEDQGWRKASPGLTCKLDLCQFGNEFTVVRVFKVPLLNTAQRVEKRSVTCLSFCSTGQPGD